MSDDMYWEDGFRGERPWTRQLRPDASGSDPWYLPADTFSGAVIPASPVFPAIPAPRTSPENLG